MTQKALEILKEKYSLYDWDMLDIQNILKDVEENIFPIIKEFNSGLKVYKITYGRFTFSALIQKTRKNKLIMITVYKD